MTTSRPSPTIRHPLDAPPDRLPPEVRGYLAPSGLLSGVEAAEALASGRARALSATGIAFSGIELVLREAGRTSSWRADFAAFEAWLGSLPEERAAPFAAILDRLTKPPLRFAGLDLARPQVMGIVNVTPDSFSDGGVALAADRAAAQARRFWSQGAAIVDIGGESTRPGAEPVPVEEELRRVAPVLDRLQTVAAEMGGLVSIDTRHAAVMAEATRNGAAIVNDVSALRDDAASLAVVADSGASVILMHRQGDAPTMNEAPAYEDVALDVYDFLSERIAICQAAGIPRPRIAVDPGFGFGKRGPHNQALLRDLPLLHGLGCPLVIGLSRKSFSGEMEERYPPAERLPGTLAALVLAMERGAQILRVHDVAEVRQAVEAWCTVTLGEL